MADKDKLTSLIYGIKVCKYKPMEINVPNYGSDLEPRPSKAPYSLVDRVTESKMTES